MLDADVLAATDTESLSTTTLLTSIIPEEVRGSAEELLCERGIEEAEREGFDIAVPLTASRVGTAR